MHEFDMIRRYLAPLATEKAALRLADDAALISPPPGQSLVITTDAIIESVHFVGDEPPALIAQKLLRVNLSDLAAMGATPYGYFLALMLPDGTDESWIKAFTSGLASDQKTFSLSLLGGDTTRIPGPLTMSATMLGYVPEGQALTRNGAQEEDGVYVTGTLGDAALGLEIALTPSEPRSLSPDPYLLNRYRLPEPRLQLAESLRLIATSCIDISDGLMQDMGHICTASGVGAELKLADIPLSPAARALGSQPGFIDAILAGGDDYELLFTAPADVAPALEAIAEECHVPITRIGRIGKGNTATILDASGAPVRLTQQGYTHF